MQKTGARTMALRLGAVAALATGVLLAIDTWARPLPYLGWLVASSLLPGMLSWLVFVNTSRNQNRSNLAFMNAVVAGLMAKLLLSLVWIGLVAGLTEVPRLQLGLAYLVPFLIYTALEVHALMNNLQAQTASDSSP
jgi:hypothetical protein